MSTWVLSPYFIMSFHIEGDLITVPECPICRSDLLSADQRPEGASSRHLVLEFGCGLTASQRRMQHGVMWLVYTGCIKATERVMAKRDSSNFVVEETLRGHYDD